MEVGQVVEHASAHDGSPVRRIQTQKPHPWLPIRFNVEPKIQLRERREIREIWKWSSHDAFHPEGHDANPGSAVKFLNIQTTRNERPQHVGGHRPMGKKQIPPRLPPSPFRLGYRPRTMVCAAQRAMRKHGRLPHNGSAHKRRGSPSSPHRADQVRRQNTTSDLPGVTRDEVAESAQNPAKVLSGSGACYTAGRSNGFR